MRASGAPSPIHSDASMAAHASVDSLPVCRWRQPRASQIGRLHTNLCTVDSSLIPLPCMRTSVAAAVECRWLAAHHPATFLHNLCCCQCRTCFTSFKTHERQSDFFDTHATTSGQFLIKSVGIEKASNVVTLMRIADYSL